MRNKAQRQPRASAWRRHVNARTGAALAVITVLIATPILVQARPVSSSESNATEVMAAVVAATRVSYVGEVTSRGGVALPADDSISGLAKLAGRDGSLRVWWASGEQWRVSVLRPTGETDYYRAEGAETRWVYESKRVTRSPAVPVRLPSPVDVVPQRLAEFALAGVRPDEVSTIGERRIAGRVADGIAVRIDDEAATIGTTEIWSDRETGLALAVQIYARGSRTAALSTRFSSLSVKAPTAEALRFDVPADGRVRRTRTIDLVAAADAYAERPLPATMAGYPSRLDDTSSVGVYGRGPLAIMTLPVRESAYSELQRAISERPGSSCTAFGYEVAEGPLSLLLPHREVAGGFSWLLLGSVDLVTLGQAVGDLPPVFGTDVTLSKIEALQSSRDESDLCR